MARHRKLVCDETRTGKMARKGVKLIFVDRVFYVGHGFHAVRERMRLVLILWYCLTRTPSPQKLASCG
jgi:hypothetical protein